MDNLINSVTSICLSKAALAAGTTTTFSTTGTTVYSIRGKAYSKAAVTNGASPTVDYATGQPFIPVPKGNGCVHMIGFDAAGNMRAVQGAIVPLDPDGNFINASQFGSLPNDFCPVGYQVVKVSNAAAGAWTFGASNNSGVAGVTYAIQDLIALPDRPQIQ